MAQRGAYDTRYVKDEHYRASRVANARRYESDQHEHKLFYYRSRNRRRKIEAAGLAYTGR